MIARPLAATLLLLTATACGGVHHVLRREVPAPRTVAVLPFGGPADAAVREGTRALVASRLQARGYHVVEPGWTDAVLSQHGWLRDPAGFDPAPLPLAAVVRALAVDAVAVGTGFDESSYNFLILRRHSFGGEVALRDAEGRSYWSANHAAAVQGGFLLTSGQVFAELRAQGEHGTPMETLALVDEFVTDVVATIPARDGDDRGDRAPELLAVTSSRTKRSDGSERLVVDVQASPGCQVRCDLDPSRVGVPMVALPDAPGHYRGAQDVPAGSAATAIVVRARNAFGRETHTEVKP